MQSFYTFKQRYEYYNYLAFSKKRVQPEIKEYARAWIQGVEKARSIYLMNNEINDVEYDHGYQALLNKRKSGNEWAYFYGYKAFIYGLYGM